MGVGQRLQLCMFLGGGRRRRREQKNKIWQNLLQGGDKILDRISIIVKFKHRIVKCSDQKYSDLNSPFDIMHVSAVLHNELFIG